MIYIFWLSILIILYVYIGYPAILYLVSLFYKNPILKKDIYPAISVIIAAYNEENNIENKIRSLIDIDYPADKLEILIGSDGSTDKTEEIISQFINSSIKVYHSPQRQGKPSMLNMLVSEAKGEILVFTDSRQILNRNSFKELVKNFYDEKIGCVSGELVYEDAQGGIIASGIGAYWDYEKYMREMESKIGSMIGATGAIYACRRSLFVPVPKDIILDDMYTPFSIVKKGYRAVFEREAKAYDVFADTPHDEHRRKKRTLSGNYQIFFRMPEMLNPFRSKIAIQIISHKILRLLAPFFIVILFVSNFFLLQMPFYKAILTAQLIFYTLAFAEALLRRYINRLKRGIISKILGIPYLFCLLNFSAVMGLLEFLFKAHDVKWKKIVN